ncbi:MAG: hypothetical protein EXS09_09990 [Gemmataceae bacterium]|nr:hypothetical protein [Gemmataceae bacterium]
MRYTNPLIASLMLFGPTISFAQDKALLAGGKEWKVIKSEEAPPGTKFMFANDGKVTLTFAVEGKAREITGTYTLTGTQLIMKLNHDGKERVETRTIKKLTETILITEDKNKKLEELQR